MKKTLLTLALVCATALTTAATENTYELTSTATTSSQAKTVGFEFTLKTSGATRYTLSTTSGVDFAQNSTVNLETVAVTLKGLGNATSLTTCHLYIAEASTMKLVAVSEDLTMPTLSSSGTAVTFTFGDETDITAWGDTANETNESLKVGTKYYAFITADTVISNWATNQANFTGIGSTIAVGQYSTLLYEADTNSGWDSSTTSELGMIQVQNGTYNDNLCPAYSPKVTMTFTPEPATATLSLLALAGLAARRRRK